MELWIPITIAAAFLQNLRSVGQKQLKGVMGTTGATFVRFGFGLPFAFFFVALLHWHTGFSLPSLSLPFVGWASLGALTQIGAQFLLIHLFAFRNFTVGTAYSRTEPVQAALFGLIFLGDVATAGTLAAIAITVAGVMMISVANTPMSWRNLFASLVSYPALVGLASGTLFGIAAVSYRGASLALGGPNFLMQGATTLAFAITLQTAVMLVWMLWRDPAQASKIIGAWKPSLFVGLVGASASLGWFTAMTLQQAAAVKALAQVEMIFTYMASIFFFREHVSRPEIIGCLLIVAGIVALLLL